MEPEECEVLGGSGLLSQRFPCYSPSWRWPISDTAQPSPVGGNPGHGEVAGAAGYPALMEGDGNPQHHPLAVSAGTPTAPHRVHPVLSRSCLGGIFPPRTPC